MNVAVVRAASAGLARHLRDHDADGPVVVGFDHRRGSRTFARETAGVLAAAGIPVRLATRHWPTPVTAYAVRDLGAVAGVMVTASHNPAPDNGYKVYDATGSQIIPPTDAEISAGIDAAGPAVDIPSAPDAALVAPLGDEAIAAYIDMAAAIIPAGPRELRAVYTPIHGVGGDLFRALWDRAGFGPPFVVGEQGRPRCRLPHRARSRTPKSRVFSISRSTSPAASAPTSCSPTIPDADRLAVAIPEGDDWRVLTGDEIGALLGAHALANSSGDDRVVARSIVSSTWLDKIAAAANVPARVTLTGFKWISRAGDADSRRLVFGYEEALGYAVTPRVRDKDGLTAALAMADLAARGSVADALTDLARAHGLHATSQWSVRFTDAADAAAFTARLRAEPPTMLGPARVVRIVDYLGGADGLPPADLVALELDIDARVLVRPSGTEPKVKCYFEVVVDHEQRYQAAEQLALLRTALAEATGTMPA